MTWKEGMVADSVYPILFQFAPLSQAQMFYFSILFSIQIFFPFLLPHNTEKKHGLFHLEDAYSEEYKTILNVLIFITLA